MLRLAECLPAMGPEAILAMPWRFAMELIDERFQESQRAAGDAPAGRTLPQSGPPLMSRFGGQHAPGFASLFRIFSGQRR